MLASTGPIGTITKDAYNRLSTEMLGMLRDEGPWDGVLIANHGAAVSEEFPDMDAAFTA
jgi:microcystin degradation protein MlrC